MGEIRFLRVPAERKYLALIRDFIHDQAITAGASNTEVESLVQAVDEASTNIMVHGYRCNPGVINIEVNIIHDEFQATLHDDAPRFDPTLVPSPDLLLPLEERPIGGLGIHLIRKCVDRLTYAAPPGGGNQLTLIKKIRQSNGSC